MADWNNRFFPEDLGPRSTIQNFKPGKRTARAITEIQEKCPNDVEVESDSDITAKIEGATLFIGGGGVTEVEVDEDSNVTASIEGTTLNLGGGGVTEVEVVYNPLLNGMQVDIDGTTLTITHGSFVPSGGSQYRYLTTDENNHPFFDVLRAY